MIIAMVLTVHTGSLSRQTETQESKGIHVPLQQAGINSIQFVHLFNLSYQFPLRKEKERLNGLTATGSFDNKRINN